MAATGAHALLTTLVGSGVSACFANPGTSEMHLVAALDDVPGMRAVLCLFEGVATGAADGYGRMTGTPAATLLHLGPGLGNGLANLHNARRAGTPVVNVVGDHATYHQRFDAPLQSDVDAVAATVSVWSGRASTPAEVGPAAAAAVAAALDGPGPDDPVLAGGRVATLVLPADVSWSEGAAPAAAPDRVGRRPVDDDAVATVAGVLGDGQRVTLLLGGAALGEAGLHAATKIAGATGAGLLAETFPARMRRGAGVPAVDRLGYREEVAVAQLDGTETLVLVGCPEPVAFFAYPGRPSVFTPPAARTLALAGRDDDVVDALERLVAAVDAGERPVPVAPARRVEPPTGPLTAANWSQALAAVWPDDAVVVDESNTSGMAALAAATAGCAAHDVLTLTGGAIGIGLPLAVGAAVACPDRPVLCLESDGSAMYTLSALWTHARERLDITTIVLDNRSYAILRHELARVGATGGARAEALLDLSRPDLDFAALATGMGVPATRATTAEELVAQLRAAFTAPGPHLIDAVLTPS